MSLFQPVFLQTRGETVCWLFLGFKLSLVIASYFLKKKNGHQAKRIAKQRWNVTKCSSNFFISTSILIFRAFKFVVLLYTLSRDDIRRAIFKSLSSNCPLILLLMESTHLYSISKCFWATWSLWMLLLNFCLQVVSDFCSHSVSLILLDGTSIVLSVSEQLDLAAREHVIHHVTVIQKN
jgi:hypothetical protein